MTLFVLWIAVLVIELNIWINIPWNPYFMVTPLVIKLVIDIFAGGLINNGSQNKKIL